MFTNILKWPKVSQKSEHANKQSYIFFKDKRHHKAKANSDVYFFRYLTTSYGTGQDIDERIVEGTRRQYVC